MENKEAVPAGVKTRVEVGAGRVQLVGTQHCRSGIGDSIGHNPACVYRWDYPGVVESMVLGGRSILVNRSVVIRENNYLKELCQFTAGWTRNSERVYPILVSMSPLKVTRMPRREERVRRRLSWHPLKEGV